MIFCDIDGIWCPKCRQMHPSLYWHKAYNDYLLDRKQKWEENKKKRPNLFGNAEYTDLLPRMGLIEEEDEGECCICKRQTFFKDINTKKYVCSNECKSKL